MIVGVGVDIIEVERIRRIVGSHGDKFLGRVFTDREIRYCRRCAHPEQRFASRFAAKEAVLKSLGLGWQQGTRFRDVEIQTNALGAPAVELHGRTLQMSAQLGIRRFHLSLSHDKHYAVAQVVAEG